MEITNIDIAKWIEDPDVKLGAESDYWRTMEKGNSYAKKNPDLVKAFLYFREYIKSLTEY